MNQYNSYYLYQQFEKRGSQDWLPSYPNIFSVDGDGTMPLVMKKENDPDCGYTGDTEPIYRWYPLPITTDYICDECPIVTYRWENMDVSTDYYCDGTTKYYKQIRQYSYDSGQTWYDVVPPEYQQGSVYEQQSTDCGYVPPTPFDGKIYLSYSYGTTYSAACNSNTTLTSGDTRPTGYYYSYLESARIGNCVTSISMRAFSACTRLTSVEIGSGVTYIGYQAFYRCSGLTSVVIPDNVTSIGNGAFEDCRSLTSCTIGSGVTSIYGSAFVNCTGLTSIVIPNSVTSIGARAFASCYSLTSCTIGSGVTSIGDWAFGTCSGLTSITVNATTPPTLYDNVFYNTNNCPIYVPSSSVETYKASSYWSSYASRIQAIPTS